MIKNPAKILPRFIIGGISALVIVYVSINIALLKVIPADQMVALGHDASAIAAQKLFVLMGGNRELEDKLDKAVESVKKSGEIDALYRKWFTGHREPD
ncbi:MAG: transporter substrate-binding domain-containing protein [Syntrophobacterales bacterium]|nr:transporter substrate-binding domain-containing protein [Syntrophobacterales bacterium]